MTPEQIAYEEAYAREWQALSEQEIWRGVREAPKAARWVRCQKPDDGWYKGPPIAAESIIATLTEHGPLPTPELREITGHPRTTLNSGLRALKTRGDIYECDRVPCGGNHTIVWDLTCDR